MQDAHRRPSLIDGSFDPNPRLNVAKTLHEEHLGRNIPVQPAK